LEKVANDTTQPQEKRDEAQQKLALVTRAKETLTQSEKKEKYDQQGIESTVYAKLVRPNILLLRIKQLSPVTYEEIQKATNDIDKNAGPNLNTLILDLRGNVGGSFDVLPYFLGFFIGKDQYAYEWYQQGNYTPFKTVVGWLPGLVRYKKVVTLIDEQVQSSAEVMAATLKKYNVGVVIGTKTKGWGTIEKVFPIDNQIDNQETYSMFLVHHITLRDDNQPIEGRGVDPTININDKNWQEQLNAYFNYQPLINAVKEIWEEK
jgi:C-terminal processing protease CtpA/Prc